MEMGLAAALRVPEHTRLSRTGLHFIFCERQGASRRYAAGSAFADSVELIVAGDLSVQRVSIILKQNEVPHEIQTQPNKLVSRKALAAGSLGNV
ncbi:hypothetical protein Pan14r_17280 [Crateriforma conspicua]|uniref:Uncharacterized protein n=1 Tax=Crateriforma conspicua TaxID=2527996 RepID=A0A5C5Y7W3_9PLAN|nr:hypothetical protein Pan14r_17280 [Crateriforma conspicua]